MNKTMLIEAVASEINSTKADAERAVNAFIDIVSAQVKKGTKVVVAGFGTFEKKHRKERTGRNPLTGAELRIKAKSVPTFKAAKAFKDLLA